MEVFARSRTLGSPERAATSTSYRVNLKGRPTEAMLQLTIKIEGEPTSSVYLFHPDDLSERSDIYFTATQQGDRWKIEFSPIRPHGALVGAAVTD